MPVGVIKICNGIMREFLWGGGENTRKIAWVSWSSVCKPKEVGGLGIKDLNLFNKSLLGKWRWRFLTEPESLWCRVIKAKYFGETSLRVSTWWRDVMDSSCDGSGDWFDLGVQKCVKKGNATKFWLENWIGNGMLCDKYHRLYNLSKLKYNYIHNCGVWEQGAWRWMLTWRRPLLGREVLWLDSLLEEVKRRPLTEAVDDKWIWLPSADGVFSVNSFYSFLQAPYLSESDPIFNRVWHSAAPSNVKAFSWKLLWDRIPCLVNLWKRKVLQSQEEANCKLCWDGMETCAHLVFSCSVAMDIWRECYHWMGVFTVLPMSPREHLLQFNFGSGKRQQRGASSIWLAIVWSIWLLRNEVVFRAAEVDIPSILELIKWRSWHWIKAKLSGFSCSLFEWSRHPLICLQEL